MKINLWNKGWVTDEVSEIPVEKANLNEENRIKWVTDLAATAYRKQESKNPEKRYKHLLKEAAPDSCENECDKCSSRPLEILPVVLIVNDVKREVLNTIGKNPIKIDRQKWDNYLKAFSYFDWKTATGDEVTVYTNMRACLKAGIPYDQIPYNSEDEILKGKFFAIRSYTPMFVWAQDKTHCRIPSVSSSGRYVVEDEYWMPDDIFGKIMEASIKRNLIIVDPEMFGSSIAEFLKNKKAEIEDEQIKNLSLRLFNNLFYSNEQFAIPEYAFGNLDAMIDLLLNWSQKKVTEFFKTLGYSLEIAERAVYYFKYKMMVRAAWGIDPRTWQHYLLERNAIPEKYKNKTQPQTAEEAAAIRKILENKYGKVL